MLAPGLRLGGICLGTARDPAARLSHSRESDTPAFRAKQKRGLARVAPDAAGTQVLSRDDRVQNVRRLDQCIARDASAPSPSAWDVLAAALTHPPARIASRHESRRCYSPRTIWANLRHGFIRAGRRRFQWGIIFLTLYMPVTDSVTRLTVVGRRTIVLSSIEPTRPFRAIFHSAKLLCCP